MLPLSQPPPPFCRLSNPAARFAAIDGKTVGLRRRGKKEVVEEFEIVGVLYWEQRQYIDSGG